MYSLSHSISLFLYFSFISFSNVFQSIDSFFVYVIAYFISSFQLFIFFFIILFLRIWWLLVASFLFFLLFYCLFNFQLFQFLFSFFFFFFLIFIILLFSDCILLPSNTCWLPKNLGYIVSCLFFVELCYILIFLRFLFLLLALLWMSFVLNTSIQRQKERQSLIVILKIVKIWTIISKKQVIWYHFQAFFFVDCILSYLSNTEKDHGIRISHLITSLYT